MWAQGVLALGAAVASPPLVMHHVGKCTDCGRAKQGQPTSWCPCPNTKDPRCSANPSDTHNRNVTEFSWDAGHLRGPPLAPGSCPELPPDPATYVLKGVPGQDLWWGRPCDGACPPPPPPPPPPGCRDGGSKACSCGAANAAKPRFHITGLSGSAHDVNAVFEWKGRAHVMHQRDNNWGHLWSSDWVRWNRLPDALVGGSWDGSLTIVNGTPLILYDCTSDANCLPPQPGGQPALASSAAPAVRSGAGDPPIVGVARPADLSDELLTNWTKDSANPAVFPGPSTYSGPSNIWINSATGAMQMEMILGHTTGLWQTRDPTLHTWELVNESFYPTRGGGGGMFYPLPGATPGSPYTHMLNEGSTCKDFVLGSFDPATSVFQPAPPSQPRVSIDLGDVYFSEVQAVAGRLVHMGWVTKADCLTAPRQITYDAELVQLLSNPLEELAALRGAVLGSVPKSRAIEKNEKIAVFSAKGAVPYDLELAFELERDTSFLAQVQLTGFSMEPYLAINVTAPAAPGAPRAVVLSGLANLMVTSFAFPAAARALGVRVLYDRTVMEIFVGGGRAVTTVAIPDAQVPGGTNVSVAALTPLTVASGTAWEMGCGWG